MESEPAKSGIKKCPSGFDVVLTPLEQRICQFCGLGKVEDEVHFTFTQMGNKVSIPSFLHSLLSSHGCRFAGLHHVPRHHY